MIKKWFKSIFGPPLDEFDGGELDKTPKIIQNGWVDKPPPAPKLGELALAAVWFSVT